ncbi:hypothetical protein IAT40_005888 [Kwoniella sp. CBS 6097]
MPPSLLYHSLNPPIYPTSTTTTTENTATATGDDDGQSLVIVRFSGPVRISNLRIIPEGVAVGFGSDHAVGKTHPSTFDAEVLLNISPSSPVNALSRSVIRITPSNHALDFPINMPVGITSRMIMIRSPAQKLSLSIYGYSGDSLNILENDTIENISFTTTRDQAAASVCAPATDVNSEADGSEQLKEDGADKEDWSWLWTWAKPTTSTSVPPPNKPTHIDTFSPDQLLDLLDPSTPHWIAQRATICIDLLEDVSPHLSLIPKLLERPSSVGYLLTTFPESPLAQRILLQTNSRHPYALHPNVVPYLPNNHPLRPLLTEASSSKAHESAWKNLSLGLPALAILQHSQGGGEVTDEELMRVEVGETESNLTRLVELADSSTASLKQKGDGGGKGLMQQQECLGLILDILDKPDRFTDNPISRSYLIRKVTQSTVIYNTRGGNRILQLPRQDAELILRGLVECMIMVVDGRSTWDAARKLALPYIDQLGNEDPLRRILDQSFEMHLVGGDVGETGSGGEDQRRLHRLSTAMSSLLTSTFRPGTPTSASAPPTPISPINPSCSPSSLIHTATPAELLHLIAPTLVEKLSTAPAPPFGITSTVSNDISDQGTKAFAGKVYTSHEFRRDRSGPGESGVGVGLGIGGPGIAGGVGMGGAPNMGGNMNMNMNMSMGIPSTGGMGVGGIGSRPASRHVDAYAR